MPSCQLSVIEAIGVEVTTSVVPITLFAAYCSTQSKAGRCLPAQHEKNWERFQQVIDSYINYEAPLGTSEDKDLQLPSIEQAILVAREQLVPTACQVSNIVTIDTLTKDLIRLQNVTHIQYCAVCV